MATLRRIRVFAASPGDVGAEREQLKHVVDEINLTIAAIAPDRAGLLELIRWETHVPPGLSRDAQGRVNEFIGDDYEIFVGILWKRMGTPTAVASSGTEEEFRRAKSAWEKNAATQVMFYFCQECFPPPRTLEEVDQLRKVVEFRDTLSRSGLVADYATHATFADVVRPHLLLTLGKLFGGTGASRSGDDAELAARVADSTVPGVPEKLAELARQYERLRGTMEPGDARTRQMEIVASKMRSFALPARGLLPSLVSSDSPGQRLAAISILEALPDAVYIRWLCERVVSEKPFAGYHAAMALLTAARALPQASLPGLQAAVEEAKRVLADRRKTETDRYAILSDVERECQRRM